MSLLPATTVTLSVREGVVQNVPADERGPFWEVYAADGPRSWACTLVPTGDPQKPDRVWWVRPRRGQANGYYIVPPHVAVGVAVEFGCNYPRPQPRAGHENEREEDVPRTGPGVPFSALRSIEVPTVTRRRWYGIVSDVEADDHGHGVLRLARIDGDVKDCMRQAKAFGLKLPARELAEYLDAARAGDLLAVAQFADWLKDQGDPRGEELSKGVLRLVADLFPGMESKP